jgi:hypothetical protein
MHFPRVSTHKTLTGAAVAAVAGGAAASVDQYEETLAFSRKLNHVLMLMALMVHNTSEFDAGNCTQNDIQSFCAYVSVYMCLCVPVYVYECMCVSGFKSQDRVSQ